MINKRLNKKTALSKLITKCILALSLLLVTGCGGIENQGVDTESAKANPLIIPPCANN